MQGKTESLYLAETFSIELCININIYNQKITNNFSMKVILLSFFFIFLTYHAFSQDETEESRTFNRDEKTGSIILTSNGWGGNFRFGKRLDGYRKRIYDIDFTEVKHPKEQRVSNPYNSDQRKFIFGKLYTLYNLKFGYGIQRELFSKFDKGGIAIKYYYTFGPTLGILKPIYYEVLEDPPSSPGDKIVSIKKFNSNIHTIDDIFGKASFFEGLSESSFSPGLSCKFGLSFEYGLTNTHINAIEVGAMFDIYLKKIELMAFNDPQQFFLSIFVAYRFGKTYGNIN
jgi:hypothetical protein